MAKLILSLGQSFDGKPIYAPKHAHSLRVVPARGGRMAAVAVPFLRSTKTGTATDGQRNKPRTR